MTKEIEWSNNLENSIRERDMRQGIDLATTLERIEKNFVISDPRLPDNPIVRIFFFSLVQHVYAEYILVVFVENSV